MKNQSQNQRITRQDIARQDDGWDNINAYAPSRKKENVKKQLLFPFCLDYVSS